VDARYAGKSIVLTSNRVMIDWTAIFPDPPIAKVIFDGIAHHSYPIFIKGESFCKKYYVNFKALEL